MWLLLCLLLLLFCFVFAFESVFYADFESVCSYIITKTTALHSDTSCVDFNSDCAVIEDNVRKHLVFMFVYHFRRMT